MKLLKWIFNTICAWTWFMVHSKDLVPPMAKSIMGRFYVFRDSPDYVVEMFADYDPDEKGVSDSFARLIIQAKQERKLRNHKGSLA